LFNFTILDVDYQFLRDCKVTQDIFKCNLYDEKAEIAALRSQ